MSSKPVPIMKRFWKKIKVVDSGCWEWQGADNGYGYGVFHDGPSMVYSHRFSFMTLNNTSIPEGLQIDHLCRNRKCANPDHLEVVTRMVNYQRGISGILKVSITHCPKGHPYNEENTYHILKTKTSHGGRSCKICRDESQRAKNNILRRMK